MVKIFTKTGDKGLTSLANGERVAKDDARIEFNGEMDSLNAMLGMVRAMGLTAAPIERLQHLLMSFMTLVARPDHQPTDEELRPFAEATAYMEQQMTEGEDHTPFCFVVPGTGPLSCWLHLARAQARTCERRLVTIIRVESATDPMTPCLKSCTTHESAGLMNSSDDEYDNDVIPSAMLRFLNRLSDYLFFLALRQSSSEA
jgi:cob(I)alamin adenosyltransferase